MSNESNTNEWLATAFDGLTSVGSDLLIVIAFRALPFLGYTLCSRQSLLRKSGASVLSGSLLLLAGEKAQGIVLWSLVGFVYYSLVVCVVHWISKGTQQLGAADRLLLFAGLLVPFMLVPATLLRPIASATFQILGFELVLKAYSYVAEQAGRQTTLRSCMFFFLVDPSIVFPQRARPSSTTGLRDDARAGARAMLGVCSMLTALIVIAPSVDLSAAWLAQYGDDAWGAYAFVLMASGLVRLLSRYCLHSGLASIQLGLLKLCGYVAPERYNYPLLARSPLDFWNRWNTYVGQWFRRYLYVPVALGLGRRARAFSATPVTAQLATAVALLVVFTAVGAFHDLYTLAAEQRLTLTTTGFFAANAGFIMIWHVAARGLSKLRTRYESSSGARTTRSPLQLERFAFGLGFVSLIAVLW